MRIATLVGLLALVAGCSLRHPRQGSGNGAQEVSQLGPEYETQNLLISGRDGASISALLVRKKSSETQLPTILQFTIYVRDRTRDLDDAKKAADRGYVGMIAYTRGKRHSLDPITPYEHDGQDAYDVIDWISRQEWSNGEVGMYGGSYAGFSQWAATKTLHPALKTIVPYVANRPGMGLPMENNIFINPNYEWTFYVTNNKTLDTKVGADRARFRRMQNTWWNSGRAYRDLDKIDGSANPLLHRWLDHPAYDKYWQDMVPYEDEFARINIPVLSVDGYYNDSQNSGLYYLREHTKYIPSAEHYLIIGPYTHFGAQRGGERSFQGIEVDDAALIDLEAIKYSWFDYVFKGKTKPSVLKDKVNYQVLGTNRWKSAPSLEKMSSERRRFYLASDPSPDTKTHVLSRTQPGPAFLTQTVDFSDRTSSTNNYYPDPIIRPAVDMSSGFVFVSEPLPEDLLVSGSFGGELVVTINKRDVDLGVSLYELRPSGDYFQLSYYLGRASFSKDPTRRQLLEPGRVEQVPLSNSRLICKKLSRGSRLVAYINVNKNPFSQLNYGTGKDVSEETIADAGTPLEIKWHSQSWIDVPVSSAQ